MEGQALHPVQSSHAVPIPRIASIARQDTESGPKFTIGTTLRGDRQIVFGRNTTLGMLKPDAMVRGLGPQIYERISGLGLEITLIDRRRLTPDDVGVLYGHHRNAVFYPELVAFLTSAEVEIFLVEGEDAVEKVNRLVGTTDPATSAPGTLRRDYYIPDRVMPQFTQIYQNVVHSGSGEKVQREIAHFLTVRRDV